MPAITRLYGPEAFGLQGLFLALSAVLGTIAGMAYPIAIILPRSDTDALDLVRLSLWIGGATTLIATVALFYLGPSILSLLNANEIASFIYLIPVAMLISVVGSVVDHWLIRKRAYFVTARVTALHSLLINVTKTSVGFLVPTAAALICTVTFGGLLRAGMMLLGLRRMPGHDNPTVTSSTPQRSTWLMARRHRDFPLLRAPQMLLNAASHSLPVMLLATCFGPAAAGAYALAYAVLTLPAGLVGGSLMQVFYPRVTEAVHRHENVKALIIKATTCLAITGLIPLAVVVITGPACFSVVFGADWHAAGAYAQWLALWAFFQYINKPAVSAIPALGLQEGLLIYEIFSTGAKVVALYVGYVLFESDLVAIALFSLSGVVAYLWLIVWVIVKSGSLPLPGVLNHA
jgi:O-antigen/teichoic acid export membrane protein